MRNKTLFASPATEVEQANIKNLVWDFDNSGFYESTMSKVHGAITSVLKDATTQMDIPLSYVDNVQQVKNLGLRLFTDRNAQNDLRPFLEFAHSASKE